MLKCIKPSRCYWMQLTLCQKADIKKNCVQFFNNDAHFSSILRGTSSHSLDYSSRSFTNCASDKAVNASYPVTCIQHSCNDVCISASDKAVNASNPVTCIQHSCNDVCISESSITSMPLRTQLHPVEVNKISHWNSLRKTQIIQPLLSHSFTVRHYAKGKDRGNKDGKGKSKVDISPEEMRQVVNGERLLLELDESIDKFKEDLTKAVAIRTNVGSLEDLPIELEGDTYPLNELAQVHRKSPTLVIINCSAFPQATKNVMTAIVESGMNLNPQQEGTSIAVPIPKVTREHREGLANKAKQLCNKCKENLRQVHNNYVRKAKGKEGQVSEDTLHKVTLKIKELMDERVKEAEVLTTAKQAELLKSS